MVPVGSVPNANAPRGPLIRGGTRPATIARVLWFPGLHGRVCELWGRKLDLLDAPAQRHRQLPRVEGVDTHAAHKVAPAIQELRWRRQLQRGILRALCLVWLGIDAAHLVLERPEVSHRRSVALSGVDLVCSAEAGVVGRQGRPELGQRKLLRAGQRHGSRSYRRAIQREGSHGERGCDAA